jgi:glycosyltransferase involved in cell wall biosynthesis
MPVFNAADVVEDAVRSVFSQCIDEVELIAVDDGSVDTSAKILHELAEEFPEMKVLEHRANKGGAVARNTAIQAAGGTLLRMIDADNIIPPGTVKDEVTVLREHGCDAVSVGQLRCFANVPGDMHLEWHMDHGHPVTLSDILSDPRTPPAHGNYLFTRRLYEAVGGYPEGFGAKDTWAFGLRHLAHGFSIHIAGDAFYYHRVSRGSSYWTREERDGRNDVNTLAALREVAPMLPPRVRTRVARLPDNAPTSILIERGTLLESSSLQRFDRAVRYAARRRWRRTTYAKLMAAGGRIRRRAPALST